MLFKNPKTGPKTKPKTNQEPAQGIQKPETDVFQNEMKMIRHLDRGDQLNPGMNPKRSPQPVAKQQLHLVVGPHQELRLKTAVADEPKSVRRCVTDRFHIGFENARCVPESSVRDFL
jgi:hypothetical protein